MLSLKCLINANPYTVMTAFIAKRILVGIMQIFHFPESDPPPLHFRKSTLYVFFEKRKVCVTESGFWHVRTIDILPPYIQDVYIS
jgi:hypothetical protein